LAHGRRRILETETPTHDVLDAEIGFLIGALADSQSRKRIADAWLTGVIAGDDAMEVLIACELIEFTTTAVND